MATYKELKGFKVRSLSSDPTTDLGQLWYNTTSNALKFDGVGAGAWASGTAVTAGALTAMSFGTTTSTVMVGGNLATTSPTATSNSYAWNGTSWASMTAFSTQRRLSVGIGVSKDSGLITCGYSAPTNYALTEEWNGTSWAEVADRDAIMNGIGGGGTVTAALATGGEPGQLTNCETWDGSTWTEISSNTTAKRNPGSTNNGTPTAFILATGAPGYGNTTEEWNGTAWTELADSSLARASAGGAGTTTSLVIYGGTYRSPPVNYHSTNTAEYFDGTTWTQMGTLALARESTALYNGSGTAALCISGKGPPTVPTVYTNVEIWDGAPVGVQTVTVS